MITSFASIGFLWECVYFQSVSFYLHNPEGEANWMSLLEKETSSIPNDHLILCLKYKLTD